MSKSHSDQWTLTERRVADRLYYLRQRASSLVTPEKAYEAELEGTACDQFLEPVFAITIG
ncbi:MAG TPA: hypothetical protein VJ695_01695 [Nitrososphaera sp.]|nr:hypothetical protein [Nitrososphaera sp.]